MMRVKILDSTTKQEFTLRGIIRNMITDHLAGFSLSGQIKGKIGCPVCLDTTTSEFLDGSKKVVYTKYRRYLAQGNSYRRN